MLLEEPGAVFMQDHSTNTPMTFEGERGLLRDQERCLRSGPLRSPAESKHVKSSWNMRLRPEILPNRRYVVGKIEMQLTGSAAK